MKWLAAIALWGVAGLVAVAVAWRLYRGCNVVLRGRFSPRVVRLVVILLVSLGLGAEPGSADDPAGKPANKNQLDTTGDELPAGVSIQSIRYWRSMESRSDVNGTASPLRAVKVSLTGDVGAWTEPEIKRFRQRAGDLSPKLAELIVADIQARMAKQPSSSVSLDRLTAIYDELEKRGLYDHWLNAYLWRKTAATEANQLAGVYARIHRHSRTADALIRAHSEVRPYMISGHAWMSKGGPKREEQDRENQGIADVLAAAKRNYPAMDGGTWKRDAVVQLNLVQNSPPVTLIRAGKRSVPRAPWRALWPPAMAFPNQTGHYSPPKEIEPPPPTIRFGRLDLLEAAGEKPVTLEHAWLGRITIPAGRTISVWQLPELLSAQGRETLRRGVQAALEGDEEAADNLELALPLTHVAVHHGLIESPQAKLAPRLRMLLTLFDDAVMPDVAVAR